ncbi:MAG: ferrous iron transport protein A [Phycisphaerae bacterium]
MSLATMPVATPCRVSSVRGDDQLSCRLMEMGLIDGAEVEVVGHAPMGDPLHIRVGDYRLSLRREHAALVDVAR